VHGRGVFATTGIDCGTRLLEYTGRVTSWGRAVQTYRKSGAESGHTFFFGLEDGRVIDGGCGGNSSRWLNHGCEPNCEAVELDGRVFIEVIADIAPGDELLIDYRLQTEARTSARLREQYRCRCGAQHCRGTMLERA
jgi:SET domain-containing protein